MGGGNSVLNKPLGSVGDKIPVANRLFTGTANLMAANQGTIKDAAAYALTAGALAESNPLNLKNTMRNIGEGLGEITGSNALRKQAMDQQQANEEEAKRQAMVSDAMARSQGGDATNIFLATGKRGKGGKGGGTGSAGTGSSRDTGVQS